MHRIIRDGVVATAVAVLIGAGVWAGSAEAKPEPTPRPVPWIGVASAWSCDRTGLVIYDQEDVGPADRSSGIKTWDVHPDKGNVVIQVHDISGRNQPDGLWVPVPITRRGEGMLGWSHTVANRRGIHWDKVRVIRTDVRVASYPAIEQPGCPPV
jgi:hypothetical protein